MVAAIVIGVILLLGGLAVWAVLKFLSDVSHD